MSVSCIIEFVNNPQGTYFAGQMLFGKITLTTSEAKQVKGIALKIKGFADTRWSKSRGTGSKRTTKHYHGHEDYIDTLTELLGSNENQSVNIEPGTHEYNFQCQIPVNCPSSFEGRHGHVRYTVQVVLIRPWNFDKTFMRSFAVVKYFDLNYDSPSLRLPTETVAEKTFGFGPFKSGPLKLNIKLPQSGYVPEQDIPISLYAGNDSKIPIGDFSIELVMHVKYFSQNHYSTENQRIVVSQMKGDPVQAYCNKLFHYKLHVPATPPTCLNFCKIIQFSYQIEIESKVQGLHINPVVCTPVTIGSVPLKDVLSAEQQQPTTSGTNMSGEKSFGVRSADRKTIAAAANVEPSAPSEWIVVNNRPTAPPAYEEAFPVSHVINIETTSDDNSLNQLKDEK